MGKNKNPPKRGQSGAFLKCLRRTWAARLLASEGPVLRLGVATETRAHGGVATEMKALANNLQRGGGGGSWGPVLTSCAGRVAQCGTVHLQGSLCCCCRPWGDGEGVTLAGTQRPLSGEPGREEGRALGEGARRDARCTTGAPAAGPGELQTPGALVDVLPTAASLSPGTTGVQGAAARSQHPQCPPRVLARTPVPHPWPW